MSETLTKGLKLGSPANPLVLALSLYEGHRLLDIRKYYVEKASKTLKPTRKGVSLNARLARQVYDALHANAEAIFHWLEEGDDSTLSQVERAMAVRTKAVEQEALKPRRYRVERDSWKGPEFFSAESQGGIDHVRLNSQHPISRKDGLSSDEITNPQSALALILAAYFRAKLRFSGELEMDAQQFFQTFEHEWGLILKNYCETSADEDDA